MQTEHPRQKATHYERRTKFFDGSEIVERLPFSDTQLRNFLSSSGAVPDGVPVWLASRVIDSWNEREQRTDRGAIGFEYRLLVPEPAAESGQDTDLSLPATRGVTKQVVAVITFDDPNDDISDLSAAATWIEAALMAKDAKLDVTVYRSAEDAAEDEMLQRATQGT